MNSASVCLILATLTAGMQPETQSFRPDYEYSTIARGWIKSHSAGAAWKLAWLRCFLEGAQLVQPEQIHVLAGIHNLFQNTNLNAPRGIYLGANDLLSRGNLLTLSGNSLNNLEGHWFEKEPLMQLGNSEKGDTCVIFLHQVGQVSTASCHEPRPFVCYRAGGHFQPQINECGNDGYSYLKTGENCYKMHPEPRTWHRAHLTCTAELAHLAIINSDAESHALKDLFRNSKADSDYALIGFHSLADADEWRTVQGETLEAAGFTSWSPGEPNNLTGNEACGSIKRNGRLNDVKCNEKLPFICEKDLNVQDPYKQAANNINYSQMSKQKKQSGYAAANTKQKGNLKTFITPLSGSKLGDSSHYPILKPSPLNGYAAKNPELI